MTPSTASNTTPTQPTSDAASTPRKKRQSQRNLKLQVSHHAQLDRAVQIIPALRALKSKEANAMADTMVAKMDEVGKETAAAHAFLTERNALKAAMTVTTDGLRTSVDGVYGLTATEPAMAAKLPVRADYASLDKVTLARKMAHELAGCGKRGALLAELLVASADAAQTAAQKLEAFVDSDAPVRNGQAAVTELQMMNLQAVALVRRSAKVGSPAWNLIKPKRKPREAKPKEQGAPPATGTTATPSPTATPVSPTQAVARA